MTNLSPQIWGFLDENPCIRNCISQKLINNRALARYIIKKRNINATQDAVISAIRRYEIGNRAAMFEFAYQTIKQICAISTKNSLANISLVKDDPIQAVLPKLFSVIHYNQGDVLRVIQGDESINILADRKNLERIRTLFPKDKIIEINENLAEISIRLPSDAQNIPGILAVIANELAMNGINVKEIMSCSPEILCFVKEENLLKAHHILYRLSRP